MDLKLVSALVGIIIVLSFWFFVLKILYGSILFALSFKRHLLKDRWKKHVYVGLLGLSGTVIFWFVVVWVVSPTFSQNPVILPAP